MPERRSIRERGGQVLVAIPALVWRRLKLTPGRPVWWHLAGKGEAILSVTERRRGGRPRVEDICPHCELREKELTKLRALVQTGGAVDTRVSFNQGYQAALKHGLRGLPALDAINDRLRRIEDLVGTRRGPWSYKVKRGGGRYRKIEDSPAPILSPPPEGGGADTSGGAAPQVSHPETETHGP